MDDIKHLTNKHSYLQLSSVLHKQVNAIREHKSASAGPGDGGKTSATAVRHESATGVACKQTDHLKLQCLSDNVQLSQLAFQTFGRLVEERTLDPAVVISMFIAMVPGASRTQLIALSEAVLQLLLLDLKQHGESYECPFGLQTPQHPLLAFFQRAESNVPDLVGKIVGLCRHHDHEIRRHSCEFLRPVYLFVFCNPNRFVDTGPLWTQLLEQSKSSEPARQLVLEVLGWSNTTSDGTLLQTSTLIGDTIEHCKSDGAHAALTHELCVYLANLLPDLIARGYDPRPALATISTVLHQGSHAAPPYLNVLLVSLSHALPICTPNYLTDLCRLLRHICVTSRGGNAVTLRLLLSALINWLAAPQLLRDDCTAHLHALVRHVTGGKWRHWSAGPPTPAALSVKYFHPAVAYSVDVSLHSERICSAERPADWLGDFRDLYAVRPQLCRRINLYLRALFLLDAEADCDTAHADEGSDAVADALLQSVRSSTDVSIDTFMTWLYRTLHEPHGRRLLRLLRGLTAFAGVKENIPKIIGALRSMGQAPAGQMRPLILELYASLWRCEDRTFVYLKNELTRAEGRDDGWQLSVAKAMTIQEICRLKPSKHGTELIVQLSNILNTCTSADGETATCIALKTIVGLCTSQTINIASTWSALRELFTAERRIRPLIVQCEFFGQVPHLVSPTANYEDCLDAGLHTLWSMIATSPHAAVQVAALQALQNYDYKTLPLAPVPAAFQPKPSVIGTAAAKPAVAVAARPAAGGGAGAAEATVDEPPPLVTGDFWPHLLQQCSDPLVAEAASALIGHHIRNELRTFRQYMYTLADGHVEPLTYNRLPNSVQSPLRAIVRALQLETNKPAYQRDQHTIRYALRSLSDGLQRPLPPLNWFWTVELMNGVDAGGTETAEARHASLRLLAHQQLHSESARQLVENYYRDFEVRVDDEELRVAIKLFGSVGRGLELATARRWLLAVTVLALTDVRRLEGDDGGLFGAVLASCATLLAHGADGGFGAENPNYAMVVETLAKYYGQFGEDCVDMLRRFNEVFEYLPTAMVERIVVPMGWQQATLSDVQWRKALHSCGHLVEASRVRRTMRWLNAAVENNTPDQQPLVFAAIDAALRRSSDERDACVWAMDILCIVQANLTTSNASAGGDAAVVRNIVYRLRMFCTVVIVRAGFDRLASRADGDDWRLAMFPESLLHLCMQLDVWQENETRIYEFFYNVLINAGHLVPAEYLVVIRNLFRCARSRPYFVQSAVWKKMVGLRQL